MRCAFLACCCVCRVGEFLEVGQMLDSDKTINEFESKTSTEKTALKQDIYIACMERMLERLKIKHKFLPNEMVDFEVSDPKFNCGIEVCASIGTKSEIQRNLSKFDKDPFASQMILHGLTLMRSYSDSLRPDGFMGYIKENKLQIDLVEFRHPVDFKEKSFFISFFDEKDASLIKVQAQVKITVYVLFKELLKDYRGLKEQSKNIVQLLASKDEICREDLRIQEEKHKLILDSIKNDTSKLEMIYEQEIAKLKDKLTSLVGEKKWRDQDFLQRHLLETQFQMLLLLETLKERNQEEEKFQGREFSKT